MEVIDEVLAAKVNPMPRPPTSRRGALTRAILAHASYGMLFAVALGFAVVFALAVTLYFGLQALSFYAMLTWLADLSHLLSPLNVFRYITFRTAFAALTALLVGLAAGPFFIRRLAALKIGQPIREYGVAAHLAKRGTPTMGGALVLLGIAVSTVLWFDWTNRFVWVVMLVTFGFGAIGWVDDWRKVVDKNPEGMRSREKYFWQSVIGLLAALYLVFSISESSNWRVLQLFYTWVVSGFDVDLPPKAGLLLPFFKEVSYPLGVFGFVILTYLVIVGSSNAVNLTDGLDGLATGASVMVFGAYTLVNIWQNNQSCALSPGNRCYDVRDPLDLAIVATAIVAGRRLKLPSRSSASIGRTCAPTAAPR